MVTQVAPAQWGAKKDYDSWNRPPIPAWEYEVVHWGGTPQPTANNGVEAEKAILRGWERFHLGKHWLGIAYCYAVGQSGTLYRLRGENRSAANGTTASNKVGRATVFIMGAGDTPSLAARNTYAAFWQLHQRPVKGHRDIKTTSCPGDSLYSWVHSGGYNQQEDDMPAKPSTTDIQAAVDAGVFGAVGSEFVTFWSGLSASDPQWTTDYWPAFNRGLVALASRGGGAPHSHKVPIPAQPAATVNTSEA